MPEQTLARELREAAADYILELGLAEGLRHDQEIKNWLPTNKNNHGFDSAVTRGIGPKTPRRILARILLVRAAYPAWNRQVQIRRTQNHEDGRVTICPSA